MAWVRECVLVLLAQDDEARLACAGGEGRGGEGRRRRN